MWWPGAPRAHSQATAVTLTSGSVDGKPWALLGWMSHGRLCLALTGAPGRGTTYNGSCGFTGDPNGLGGEGGGGPAGSSFLYGPAGPDAVQAGNVGPSGPTSARTRPFPSGYGFPHAAFYVLVSPDGSSGAADITLLDRDGSALSFGTY